MGIITNSHSLSRIHPNVFDAIKWIRISLIKLDEGKYAEDYDFCGFPESKIGMSYVYYGPNAGRRNKRRYCGSSEKSAREIVRMYDLHPDIKFIRIAADASLNSKAPASLSKDIAFRNAIASRERIFIQDTGGSQNSVFDRGCYVGAIRPFVGCSPEGDGKAYVYICSCHTHFCGNKYDKRFALCNVAEVKETWERLSQKFAQNGYPYEVEGNAGTGWRKTCQVCYYGQNNALLHGVAQPIDDANFA
ncbi:MAG: hypothetical protein ACT4O2_01915 [Beijerinckiaceae bacterium]